jgi:thiosulfate reductase cytochrome b subunit
MGAASVITGLAIYKPLQLSWLTNLLGGYDGRAGSISG